VKQQYWPRVGSNLTSSALIAKHILAGTLLVELGNGEMNGNGRDSVVVLLENTNTQTPFDKNKALDSRMIALTLSA